MIRVIVATHKPYSMPQDPMYLPLHVGRSLGEDLGYTGDDTGDHISHKNPVFCELTGLYWAWKNLSCDILGLVHYRRYFAGTRVPLPRDPFARILTEPDALRLFSRCDVVVPAKRHYLIETLGSHYAHTHDARHLAKTRDLLSALSPEYLGAFDRVMRQRSGYLFNMFLMEKSLADAYCAFLFPVLFALEEQIDVEPLSDYDRRFCGRIAELLFNIWLDHHALTVKTAPCLHLEPVPWLKKGRAFLRAKLFHKPYHESF